jgi:glucans biosynthesis protein C
LCGLLGQNRLLADSREGLVRIERRMTLPANLSRSSVALSNLRAVVILIVLAFHSVLAYVQFIPVHSGGFDAPPYGWRAFPIVDGERWFGFDLFCAWQDVYLMSLMFLLSGLFVWPSLQRKRHWAFARDRLRRLGIPFAFGVLVLVPISVYPAYLVRGGAPDLSSYWQAYVSLPFLPNGQLWFLWQLLALNIVAAAIYWIAPGALEALGRLSADLGRRPRVYFAVLVAASAVAYVPLALLYTPWQWSDSGLLSVQWCRPLLYGVNFFAGVGIGAAGIDAGLLAADGLLARRWKLWLGVALASLFLWMSVTSLTMNGPASLVVDIAADVCFVVACSAGAFFVVATSLRFGTRRLATFESLSVNAYSLYLVHYTFVVWLQYALLGIALFALVKGAIVFGVTAVLSWLTIIAYERGLFGIRLLAKPLFAKRARSTSPPVAEEPGFIAEPSGPPR